MRYKIRTSQNIITDNYMIIRYVIRSNFAENYLV